MHGPM